MRRHHCTSDIPNHTTLCGLVDVDVDGAIVFGYLPVDSGRYITCPDCLASPKLPQFIMEIELAYDGDAAAWFDHVIEKVWGKQ